MAGSGEQGALPRSKRRSNCSYRLLILLLIFGISTLTIQLDLSRRTVNFDWKNKQNQQTDYFGEAPGSAACEPCPPCQLSDATCLPAHVEEKCPPCDYTLERLEGSNITVFNLTTQVPGGSSNSFLYRVTPPKQSRSFQEQDGTHPKGWPSDVLVKISCLPYFNHAFLRILLTPVLRPLFDRVWKGGLHRDWLHLPCTTVITGNLDKIDVAMWNLARKCKVDHLLPEVRLGIAKGIMPETGYAFEKEALFMKEAKGMSLKSFINNIGQADFMRDFFMKKLNSSQVVEAAIFDLLTMQRDRGEGNLYIDESGNIMLIDNNQVLEPKIDSLFLPFTKRNVMAHVGRKYLSTRSPGDLLRFPLPEARLDYRCHAGGTIGKTYPPGLHSCIKDIALSREVDLMREIGLEDRAMISRLKRSAGYMLTKGFEWTLANWGGTHFGKGSYTKQDPCCEMVLLRSSATSNTIRSWFKCESTYSVIAEID